MCTQAKRTLLITGAPGIGKTTMIRKVVEALSNLAIAGFYTEEIREEGERQGFRLVTFKGEEGVIAHVNFNHGCAVGKYGVDVAAIDRFADQSLAIVEGIDLYIVDEIGKMECLSHHFDCAIRALLDAEKTVIATIAKKGAGLIEEVKLRPECDLWEITRSNRETLLSDVIKWVQVRAYGNPG